MGPWLLPVPLPIFIISRWGCGLLALMRPGIRLGGPEFVLWEIGSHLGPGIRVFCLRRQSEVPEPVVQSCRGAKLLFLSVVVPVLSTSQYQYYKPAGLGLCKEVRGSAPTPHWQLASLALEIGRGSCYSSFRK